MLRSFVCVALLLCTAACGRTGVAPDAALELTLVPVTDGASVPFALTATDGTGLALKELRAQVVLQGPLAFTQLEFAFENPEARRLEGRLSLVLPEGASISRLALSSGERYLEGEVVERPRAIQAYEEALYGRRDPALLEHDAGNEYRLRIFPIEAHETKRVIVAYSQLIAGADENYRLLLAGLPKLDHVRVEVHGAGFAGRFERRGWTPSGDLEVALPATEPCAAATVDGLVLLPAIPAAASSAAHFARLSVLLDTSASSALHFEQRLARLGDLLAALTKQRGGPFPVQLIVFDQEVVPLLELRSDQFGPALRAQLLARGALGATDLEAALRALAKLTTLGDRVLVYSDGIATAGASHSATLSTRTSALAKAGVERVDVLSDRRQNDRATLSVLVHSELPEAGVIVWDDDAGLAARRLLLGTERRVPLTVRRAEWTYPSELRGVQPGRVYPVFAKFGEHAPDHVQLGEQRFRTCRLDAVDGQLLTHAWARTQVDYLQQKLAGVYADDAERIKKRIVQLSTGHRVLSEQTAWVVLETEQDYQRHGIERGSPRLMVRHGALHLRGGEQRLDDWLLEEPWLEHAPEVDSDAGGLGPLATLKSAASRPGQNDVPPRIGGARGPDTIGAGAAPSPDQGLGQGFAGSAGNLYGGSDALSSDFSFNALGAAMMRRSADSGYHPRASSSGPSVESLVLGVRGGLDKEPVRRVIARHINEVRFCYEQGLVRRPDLRGRVDLRFIVSPSGSVQAARVNESSLGERGVERCVESAVAHWVFPAPSAGQIAIVQHSFEFVRGAGEASARTTRAAIPEFAALVRQARERAWNERPRPVPSDALEGPSLEISTLLEAGARHEALELARATQRKAPGDIPALLSLARSAAAAGEGALAARAYGSLIDLFPSRAELRRAAGEGLESLELGSSKEPLALAIDSYRKAKALRPDQPNGYRLLALALLRAGDREGARNELAEVQLKSWPWGRFAGVTELLSHERTLIAPLAREPLVRICIYWENDATDVDLHVYDGVHRHVGDGADTDQDGPRLTADVSTGFGPECVTASGAEVAYPYLLQVHYAARGAMGYAIGAAHIMQVEANGRTSFEMRPFVIMKEQAYVALGEVQQPG